MREDIKVVLCNGVLMLI
jgi:hypothetical protein